MNRSKLIQRIFLAVAVSALTATIVVFVGYRKATRDPAILLDNVPKEVDMQLARVRQTAMRHGIREWQLEADSVAVSDRQKTMVLTRPDVEFFMKTGESVHMTADTGTIQTDSNQIQISGKVAARTQQYRLTTEEVEYDPKKRQLRSTTPVTVKGDALRLTADRMTMDLDADTTRFEGNVQGVFHENLQL